MRLADLILRRGHLSEDALTAAVLDGSRPEHLDHCDVCARRALDLGRWLDVVQSTAVEAADEAFPAERLAAQQSQILRRLERIDEPARVITFRASTVQARPSGVRRVAPAWLGVAAAAGLAVGVIGGRMVARFEQTGAPAGAQPPAAAAATVTHQPAPAESRPAALPDSILEMDLEGFTPATLQGIDEMTPRIVQTRFTVALR